MASPPRGPFHAPEYDVCENEERACGSCANCTIPQIDPTGADRNGAMRYIDAIMRGEKPIYMQPKPAAVREVDGEVYVSAQALAEALKAHSKRTIQYDTYLNGAMDRALEGLDSDTRKSRRQYYEWVHDFCTGQRAILNILRDAAADLASGHEAPDDSFLLATRKSIDWDYDPREGKRSG